MATFNRFSFTPALARHDEIMATPAPRGTMTITAHPHQVRGIQTPRQIQGSFRIDTPDIDPNKNSSAVAIRTVRESVEDLLQGRTHHGFLSHELGGWKIEKSVRSTANYTRFFLYHPSLRLKAFLDIPNTREAMEDETVERNEKKYGIPAAEREATESLVRLHILPNLQDVHSWTHQQLVLNDFRLAAVRVAQEVEGMGMFDDAQESYEIGWTAYTAKGARGFVHRALKSLEGLGNDARALPYIRATVDQLLDQEIPQNMAA